VIAYNEIGLDIYGASETSVSGNWFGMGVNGVDPGPQTFAIKITNFKPPVEPEVKAEQNDISANVISAADNGIELNGDGSPGEQAPASGPTTIHGNYIGLIPTGEEAVKVQFPVSYEGVRFYGVRVGAAGHVTIGGTQVGDANFFAGGDIGVKAANAVDFEAKGNVFGETPGGAPATPQSSVGIFAEAALGLEGPVIAENLIRMGEPGTAIEEIGGNSTISANMLEGGEYGIYSEGSAAASGSLIEGNLIEGPEEAGIVVGNPDNEVLGNEILGSESMGIEVSGGSATDLSGNLVGGNSAAAENAIFDSGDYAILIHTTEASRNEIGRNHGSGNGGEGFIILRSFGAEGDPNGAKRPTITSAGKTEASGKALPGALVRIFRKASTEEGELAGFLGQGIANGSGEWKVSYGAVPGKTLVTATQTNTEHGTSDLAETVSTPPDPPAPPVCTVNCGPPAPSPSPSPPVDTTKPKVTIKSGPKSKSTSTTAKFKFSSNEAGSTFQCKLDNKAFAKCSSPKTYKKLKPGKHVFKVKATDAAGAVGAVVKRTFTVIE
jgi:hypothetical protein